MLVLALPVSAKQAAASVAGQAVTTQSTAGTQDYLLGVGDIIEISVLENADRSPGERISEIANTTYPLIGSVRIGGTSNSTQEKHIAKTLVDGVLLMDLPARVLVDQIRNRQFADNAGINRLSGSCVDLTQTKLIDLIVLSGDIAKSESDKVIFIRAGMRKLVQQEFEIGNSFLVNRQPENGIYVQASDARLVDRLPQYYIYPKVWRPGSYRVEWDTSLVNALAIGKEFAARGTQSDVSVNRKDSARKVAQPRPGIVDPVLRQNAIVVRDGIY